MIKLQFVRYNIGQVIWYCFYVMCGVIYDVEMLVGVMVVLGMDEIVFGLVYCLFVEDDEILYEVCIVEQDLLLDEIGELVSYFLVGVMFELGEVGDYCCCWKFIN